MATLDASLVTALRDDWKTAPIAARDRAMLAYCVKLTVASASVRREDVEALRAEGFDDVAITQINLIASFFNYVNRVADGLGVARE
jgi:uncharacterized peroxidase-related enzyme